MNPSRWPKETDATKCPPSQDGWAWVWNKRAKTFTFTTDGHAVEIAGRSALYMPVESARLAHKQSLEQLHPDAAWSTAVRWPEGSGDPDDPDFGEVLDTPRGASLFDFEADPNPQSIPVPDGLRTHVATVAVQGAKAAMTDRRYTPERG